MNEEGNRNILDETDLEAENNLIGFFDMLLKIDRRNNPQNYIKEEKYEDNRSPNYADKGK